MTFEDFFAEGAMQGELMRQVRRAVRESCPDVTEKISYGMPAWSRDGKILLYARAQTGHLGLYPEPAFILSHQASLVSYATSKGSIRFPYDGSVAALTDLVKQIVHYNLTKEQA